MVQPGTELLVSCHICFVFKQKTAYEMRISDWSSDVCSSDLGCARADLAHAGPLRFPQFAAARGAAGCAGRLVAVRADESPTLKFLPYRRHWKMTSDKAAAAATLETLDTPCLLLDEPRMQANIERLKTRMARLGVTLRPQLKPPDRKSTRLNS